MDDQKVNVTMVGVGKFRIGLNEEILKRLLILSECDYMQASLEELTGKIVDIYNENDTTGGVPKGCLTPEICMDLISLIYDIKNDYKFLCSLNVEQEV